MDNYHLAPGSQHKISDEKSSKPSICITSSHQNNFHIEGSPTRLSEHSTFSSAVEKVVTWHKANSKFFGEDRHCSTYTVFKDTHKRKINSQDELWKLVTHFPTHWAPHHWQNSQQFLVVGNLMSLRYYDFLLVCVCLTDSIMSRNIKSFLKIFAHWMEEKRGKCEVKRCAPLSIWHTTTTATFNGIVPCALHKQRQRRLRDVF